MESLGAGDARALEDSKEEMISMISDSRDWAVRVQPLVLQSSWFQTRCVQGAAAAMCKPEKLPRLCACSNAFGTMIESTLNLCSNDLRQ